jgi:ABC-type transport system involved in multi-copper enzyme maturation permease subunit
MTDLVWKDIVVARWVLILLIPFYVLQLAFTASQAPIFFIFTTLFTGLLGFGSIGLEDHQNTESLWCSLPVTRRDVVLARYLSTALGLLLGLGLSWSIGRATTLWMGTAARGGSAASTGFLVYAALFALLVLLAAVFLPCYFRFGAGRGLVVFSAIGIGVLIVAPLLLQLALLLAGYGNPLMDPEVWRRGAEELDAEEGIRLARRVVAGLTVLACGAALLSAGLSVRFFEKRDL